MVADYDNVRGSVRVTGITALNLQASGGDSAWLGWPMIAVTWSNARDQVDANTEFLTEAGLRVGDHLTINVGRRLVTTTIVGQVYDPNGPSLSTSRQMLGAVPGLGVTSYRIGLAPGISPQRYSGKLSWRLGPSIGVLFACQGTSRSSAATLALLRALTEMIVLLAGLGVLSSVLIATRERVRGLGVFKSLGMTPRQTPVMVVCGNMPPAIAAVIAIPAATYLHAVTVQGIGTLTDGWLPVGAYSHEVRARGQEIAARRQPSGMIHHR